MQDSLRAVDNIIRAWLQAQADGRPSTDRNILKTWIASRGILPSTARRWPLGYVNPQVFTPSQAELEAVKLDLAAFISSGLFSRRRGLPQPEGEQEHGSDVGTSRTHEGPDLFGLRSTLGDCVALPVIDTEGTIRSWVGRRVHTTQTLAEISKDFHPQEDDPYPIPSPAPKYRFLKKRRWSRNVGDAEEIEVYPIILSPRFRALSAKDKTTIWITEGIIDGVTADQAGVAAVSMGGAYAYDRQTDLLVKVLKDHARDHRPIYLCFDFDPARKDKSKILELGPGQRGAADLLGEISKRDKMVARAIRVVILPATPDQKMDLADYLHDIYISIPQPQDPDEDVLDLDGPDRTHAWEKSIIDAQAKALEDLQAASVEGVDYMISTLPPDVRARDRGQALEEVGLLDVIAHDPELWSEVAEKVADRLQIPKGERRGWKKEMALLASSRAKREAKNAAMEDDHLGLYRRKDGAISPEYPAVKILVAKMLPGLTWDEMALTTTRGGKPLTQVEVADTQYRLGVEHRCDCSRKMLEQVIADLSRANPVHPVREYLTSLPAWDEVDRIPELLGDVLHVADKTTIYAAYLRRWMIAAVARAMTPGCKADTMLCLIGRQGVGKSTFFTHLCPREEWTGSPDIADLDRDTIMSLRRLWIAEVSEIDRGSWWKDLEAWKAFLTRAVDVLRLPYAAETVTLPRSCVIGGTTNSTQFLADSSGSRRYWCLPVDERVDLVRLRAIRDHLWAQALHAFRAGEQWYLTDNEEALRVSDCETWTVEEPELERVRLALGCSRWITTAEIAAGLDIEKPTSADSRRISKHMAALGWSPAKNSKVRGYAAPVDWMPEKPKLPDELDLGDA